MKSAEQLVDESGLVWPNGDVECHIDALVQLIRQAQQDGYVAGQMRMRSQIAALMGAEADKTNNTEIARVLYDNEKSVLNEPILSLIEGY